MSLQELNLQQLDDADYIIVYSPDPAGAFSEPFLNKLASRQNPVMWVGFAPNSKTQTANAKVTDIPPNSPAAFAFAEMLLDFYGIRQVASGRLLLRIEDYDCESNHRDLRRMADFLFSRKIPFGVGVRGACDLNAQAEFADTLRYVQKRGGRLIIKGGIRDPFWDAILDKPRSDISAANIRVEITGYLDKLKKHGLSAIAWENPDVAISEEMTAELSKLFPVMVGPVQLSDATARDQFIGQAPVRNRYGTVMVPDNAGFVPVNEDTEGYKIKEAAANLLRFRGAVASCAFHVYLPFSKLVALVAQLEELHVPFMDLDDLKDYAPR